VANPFIALSNKISCALDNKRDLKTCGEKLGVFVPSPFDKEVGATGCQSAPYKGLDVVLQDLRLSSDDSFIDIGCGKGRVLAYLVGKGVPCKLTGIEINPEVASVADRWTKRYRNIEIVEGDAFGLDYNDYTVLFMYRPMESDVFKGFVNLLEMTLTHPVKFYYYADGQSGYYLNERPGWDLLRRQELHSARGLYIHKVPQRFSVWQYTP
jgi:SAM-dependent methyltransferase